MSLALAELWGWSNNNMSTKSFLRHILPKLLLLHTFILWEAIVFFEIRLLMNAVLAKQHAALKLSFFFITGTLANPLLHQGMSVAVGAELKTLQCCSWHRLKGVLNEISVHANDLSQHFYWPFICDSRKTYSISSGRQRQLQMSASLASRAGDHMKVFIWFWLLLSADEF